MSRAHRRLLRAVNREARFWRDDPKRLPTFVGIDSLAPGGPPVTHVIITDDAGVPTGEVIDLTKIKPRGKIDWWSVRRDLISSTEKEHPLPDVVFHGTSVNLDTGERRDF